MNAEHQLVITIKPGWFKKQIGVRFDMLCFFSMLEEFGIGLGDDVGGISKVPYDEMLSIAVYTGYQSYCFKHKQVPKYSKDDILKWVDNSVITRGHFKLLGALWNDFMKDYTDVEKKKKAKD
jgi:hypothetical protein